MLQGKNILVGITGSIAAYKAAILVRGLVKQGAHVKVIMTPLAKEFITPLTMATVSKNPILVDFFDPEDGRWNSHVSLGEWADAYLIAPATANTMGKMAYGIADNLLLTTYLSARCPVFIAPAMDLDMFAHPATQANIETLRTRGVKVVDPDAGELASGLVGKGRMAEPERIVDYLTAFFKKNGRLSGRKVIVTAGGTVEAIDPVRYISNHSTGKMGYAIAGELAARGAQVTLISAPTGLPVPTAVERVDVVSAEDMYNATLAAFEGSHGGSKADGAVMCAAVADYTPANPSACKIKKSAGEMSIPLKKTIDIAAELGKVKGDRLLVGFALETDNEEENAKSKLERKNLDMVVLNSLKDEGAGFGTDTNKVTIIDKSGQKNAYPLASKAEVATIIADRIEEYFRDR